MNAYEQFDDGLDMDAVLDPMRQRNLDQYMYRTLFPVLSHDPFGVLLPDPNFNPLDTENEWEVKYNQ